MQNQPVYKIYSRKRFRLNFLKNDSKKSKLKKKLKKVMPLIIIIVIAISTYYIIWKSVYPVFESTCEDEAKAIATKVTNEETTNVMNKYNYNNFFTIEKDKDGNVQMITANILQINQVTSDIALNIQNAFERNENSDIDIPVGTFSGVKLFSGLGPRISIKLSTVGTVETNVRSEFISEGVNQTIHRVYLDIDSIVNVLTSSSSKRFSIKNQVLILENVILGEIPSNYYNFEGMKSESDLLEAVQ